MKKLVIALFFSSLVVYAQQTTARSPFISGYLGIIATNNSRFEKIYDSKIGLSPAIGLGIPLSTRLYIYGKVSYFSKKGVPVFSTYEIQDGKWILVSEEKRGSASFHEWFFNVGLLYKIFLSEDYTLGLEGGITEVNISEEANDDNGSLATSMSATGILGPFAGISLERNFKNSPFALTGEVQYNFSRSAISNFIGKYGGLSVMLGVRYYFKERRVQ